MHYRLLHCQSKSSQKNYDGECFIASLFSKAFVFSFTCRSHFGRGFVAKERQQTHQQCLSL